MLRRGSASKLRQQLKIFGFETYKEFLYSPIWFEFKDQFKETQDCSYCRKCGSTNMVSFHHTSYKNLLNPSNIAILCDKCHKKQHLEKASIQCGLYREYTLGSYIDS